MHDDWNRLFRKERGAESSASPRYEEACGYDNVVPLYPGIANPEGEEDLMEALKSRLRRLLRRDWPEVIEVVLTPADYARIWEVAAPLWELARTDRLADYQLRDLLRAAADGEWFRLREAIYGTGDCEIVEDWAKEALLRSFGTRLDSRLLLAYKETLVFITLILVRPDQVHEIESWLL